MYSITIMGAASGKVVKTIVLDKNLQEISLMEYLISQGIPIASSCKGEGVCQKCTVNEKLISCQISLSSFLSLSSQQIISISYL